VIQITVVSKQWWVVDALYAVGLVTRDDMGPAAQGILRVLGQSSSSAAASTSPIATTPGQSAASIIIDKAMQQGVSRAFGRATAQVRYGDLWAEEFDLGMYFATDADFEDFNTIRERAVTLLLKSDMLGKTYWVSLGGERPDTILRAGDRQENPRHGLSMHCTPVDAAL
jgi:hypothetical protein